MKFEDCLNCKYFVEHRADSVLCSYDSELESRVVSGGKIVGCPQKPEKKGLKKLFSRD